MKLCIISYYGFIETFKYAKEALENNNIEVLTFPLYKYIHDINDRKNNYLDLLKEYILDNNIDYVLWWFINIPTDEFIWIKHETNVKYLFFNWDEPFNWKYDDLYTKSKYFDEVFVTCKETLKDYLDNGVNNALCLYPGFSNEVNYKIINIDFEDFNNYACDISICCTNLYEDEKKYPNQYINRKKLIDDIYKNQSKYHYTFHIYGPENLKYKYPKSYKGFSSYYQLNKIFNYSKINLCTHVVSDKYGYLNERCILIGASGGLLLVDSINGIEETFEPNKEIIILDKNNYINQIVNIINNYEDYIDIKNNLHKKVKEKYNYNKWAETISNIIKNN